MTKRPNRAGSISLLANGKFRAEVILDDAKRSRISRTRATRAEAEIALAELLAQRDAGALRATNRQTLATYLDDWLRTTKKIEVRPHTYEGYVADVANVCRHIGKIQLERLTPAHVRSLRAGMLAEGYAPVTVNRALVQLRSACRMAVDDGLIASNPARTTKLIPLPRVERHTLPPACVAPLLAHTEGTVWHALWALMLGTGLRVGEALGLVWDDLDPDYRMMHIRHTATRTQEGAALGPPKTASSVRDVLLPAPVSEALRRHKPLILRLEAATEGWVDRGLVFPGVRGGFGSAQTVGRNLRFHLEAIGAPPLTPHALRHSYATYQLLLGTRIEVVQRVLGHANVAMTSDLYSHVLPEMQEEAADAMASFMTRRNA